MEFSIYEIIATTYAIGLAVLLVCYVRWFISVVGAKVAKDALRLLACYIVWPLTVLVLAVRYVLPKARRA